MEDSDKFDRIDDEELLDTGPKTNIQLFLGFRSS